MSRWSLTSPARRLQRQSSRTLARLLSVSARINAECMRRPLPTGRPRRAGAGARIHTRTRNAAAALGGSGREASGPDPEDDPNWRCTEEWPRRVAAAVTGQTPTPSCAHIVPPARKTAAVTGQ
jgi:hypothetical protein